MRHKRRTQADLMVVGALAAGVPMMGYDLMKATGMSSGRVYISLAGLEGKGIVERRKVHKEALGRETTHWVLT